MAKDVEILSGTIELVMVVTRFITYFREIHNLAPKKVQRRAGGWKNFEKWIIGRGGW